MPADRSRQLTAEAHIAAIVEAPDDLARFSVYADWLLERGDPRGELVSLSLAHERQPDEAIARRIDVLTREERWLSPRLAAQAHFWTFALWRGFVRTARLIGAKDDPPFAEAAYALFADPHASLVERLDLAAHEEATRAVFEAPRPTVKQLAVRFADIGPLLHRLPELSRLDVFAGGSLDRLVHERLGTLVGPVAPAVARRLALDLPALEQLRATGDADIDELAHPRLRRLGAALDRCSALRGAFELPALEELDVHLPLDRSVLGAPRSIFQAPPPRFATLAVYAMERDPDLRARLMATPLGRQAQAITIRHPPF